MKKRILSIFAVLAVAVNMVGCTPPNTAAPAEVTEQIIVETTAETIELQETETSQTEKDYSEYEEFPEGWSAERVLNMISIDGHQLSFPCKIDDILALSEDFDVRNKHYHSETEELAELYYKDIEIADIGYYLDESINYIYINNFGNTGYIKIENIDINDTENLIMFFSSLMENPGDKYGQRKMFIENYTALIIRYSSKNHSLVLSWEVIE